MRNIIEKLGKGAKDAAKKVEVEAKILKEKNEISSLTKQIGEEWLEKGETTDVMIELREKIEAIQAKIDELKASIEHIEEATEETDETRKE